MKYVNIPRDLDGEDMQKATEKFEHFLARLFPLPNKIICETTPTAVTHLGDQSVPERIYVSPDDAKSMGSKYGHPDLDAVCVGDDFVEYKRVDTPSVEKEPPVLKEK